MASPLSCKLCSKSFTDPRLLPCLHIFCKSCLESLQSQNEGTLTCPTCYKTSPHPPANLPRHLRMEKDSTLSWMQQSREVVCGTCEKNNKAEAYCEDCHSAICSNCVDKHREFSPFRTHCLLPLCNMSVKSTQDRHSSTSSSASCESHPDHLLKYYFLLGDLACGECILESEKDYRRINDAVEDAKAELLSCLEELERVAPLISKSIKNVENVISSVQIYKEQVKGEIDDVFQEISGALEKKRLELHKDLDSAAITKTTQLQLQKEGLESLSSAVQLAIDSDKVAHTEYSNIEFLAVKSFLQDASESLAKETLSTDLSPIVVSTFSQNIETTKLIETISSLSRICSHSYSPALSSFVGINPKMAIGVSKGSKCNLILQTRDSRGEDVTEGGIKVNSRIKSVSADSEAKECVVTDLSNGRFEINFDNPVEGQHQLHVTIDDITISNSPFTVNVRDYTTVKSPDMPYVEMAARPLFIDIASDVQYVSINGGTVQALKNG